VVLPAGGKEFASSTDEEGGIKRPGHGRGHGRLPNLKIEVSK